MRWTVLAIIVSVAASVGVNVVLLGHGATRHDPVGRLSPVLRAPSAAQPIAPPRAAGEDD